MKGTLVDKRYLDLAGRIGSNLPSLVEEKELEYYLAHPEEIPLAISRGFIIPDTDQKTTFGLPRLFKAEDTNLTVAITETEKFSTKVLGQSVNLREVFSFPAELPWRNVLVVFDPRLTNRQAVDRALKSQKLEVYEGGDVMEYEGSEKEKKPSLCLIENLTIPTADTLGEENQKSPDELNEDGRPYLSLRSYALAFGLRFFTKKDYLDPETWTWFPRNRLSGGGVACGRWYPRRSGVKFGWSDAGLRDPRMGARLAMPVSLKP